MGKWIAEKDLDEPGSYKINMLVAGLFPKLMLLPNGRLFFFSFKYESR
jgi:hypothetical protein